MNNRYILRTVFSQKKVVNHPNNYLNQIESRTDSHKIKEFLDIFVPFLLLVIIFFIIFAFTYLILLSIRSVTISFKRNFCGINEKYLFKNGRNTIIKKNANIYISNTHFGSPLSSLNLRISEHTYFRSALF